MSSRKGLRDALLDGLEQLVREGSKPSYWLSTRATADAVIALNTCLPFTEFSKLRKGGLQFIQARAETSANNSLNWDEEVWDTSIATMALAIEPVKYADAITRAVKWLETKYLATHTSWNEEIWETLLALNSLAAVCQSVPSAHESQYDFTRAVEWLMEMVDTPRKGVLINWSSTALFILLAKSAALPVVAGGLGGELDELSGRCAQVIFETAILADDELLWTPEVWSNGLVLWALASSSKEIVNPEKSFKIAKWFRGRIAAKDLPTEDRAFACIGLYKYLELMEIHDFLDTSGQNINSQSLASRIEELQDKLQCRIALALKERISDFQSAPPLFSHKSFAGYYSVNIKSIIVNVLLIMSLTFLLSYLSWNTQSVENKLMKWLILIPIIMGTFATVSQLVNFSLFPKRKSTSPKQDTVEDES